MFDGFFIKNQASKIQHYLFDMKGLLQRISTAVIFVVVMLGGLYGGRYSFVLLFALITGLCLWEFLTIVLTFRSGKKRDILRRILGLLLGLTPFILVSIHHLKLVDTSEQFIVSISLLFFPLLFLAFIYELYSRSDSPFQNVAFMVLGLLYIGVPFSLLDFIAFDGNQFNTNVVFGLLLLSWSNDTFAYLVGSRIGKIPLFPSVSPKKTWEGSLGGGVLTILLALILGKIFAELNITEWLFLGIIVVVFGTLGDLVESMLKRTYKIKDSGHLLPGHGGLLDRFDGFIFLLPYATAYLLLIR